MQRLIVLTVLCFVGLAVAPLYQQMKSDVVNLNQINFETQITKLMSTGGVSIVHFYSHADGKSPDLKKEYERFATEFKGIFKVGAVNCDESAHLCEKHDAGVVDLPRFRVFPTMPMPPFNLEGDFEFEKLKKTAARLIQSPPITELTDSNIDGFLRENEGFPKSILFTKSKSTPLIYKALAKDFKDTILFGIVRADNQILKRRFKITELPSLIVVEKDQNNPERFKGKMKFAELFQFLNVYSEVFVQDGSKTGGKQMVDIGSKPWLTQKIPQLTVESAEEVCFDLLPEKFVCIIHLGSAPTEAQIAVLDEIKAFYEPKGSRGAKLKSSWIDSKIEKEWRELFGIEVGATGVGFIKGKKNKARYLLHDGDYSVEGLKHTVDKIMGGDARFKMIKARPGFVASYEEGSAGAKTEDL